MRIVRFSTGRKKQDDTDEVIVVCTNRLDLDAELIVLAYRYRWQVELFFRWLKCILGCRGLISQNANGAAIQVYAALIASILLTLYTGAKPNKRTYEMICHYFAGWADEEELMAHHAKQKS